MSLIKFKKKTFIDPSQISFKKSWRVSWPVSVVKAPGTHPLVLAKKNVFLGRERAQIVSKAEQDFNFPSLAAVHKFILM